MRLYDLQCLMGSWPYLRKQALLLELRVVAVLDNYIKEHTRDSLFGQTGQEPIGVGSRPLSFTIT
jgi:hypothetical protein